jgi:hypothetical protein
MLEKMEEDSVKPQYAKEYFNGCGKIINHCKNQLQAISMGVPVDVDLLEIKAEDIDMSFIKPIVARKMHSLLD